MQNMRIEIGLVQRNQLALALVCRCFTAHNFHHLHGEVFGTVLANSLAQAPGKILTLRSIHMLEPAPVDTGCHPTLINYSYPNVGILVPLHDVDHMPRVAAPLTWSGFGVHVVNLARSCPLSTKKVPGVACSLTAGPTFNCTTEAVSS